MLGVFIGWLTGWPAALAGCFLVGCALCSMAALVALAGCLAVMAASFVGWLRRLVGLAGLLAVLSRSLCFLAGCLRCLAGQLRSLAAPSDWPSGCAD